MPQLNNLDDMPCFEKDRRIAAAFMAGGMDGERAMRATLKEEEEALRNKNLADFNEMVARARAEALINPPTPHDTMRFRAVPPGVCVTGTDSARSILVLDDIVLTSVS